MLRGIVICPDSQLAEQLDQALAGTQSVSIARDFDRYPDEVDFMRAVRAYAPQVVLLSTESMSQALGIIGLIEREAPGLQVVAVSRSLDPAELIELMRAGIREFLAAPLEVSVLAESLGRVAQNVASLPSVVKATDQLFAFLPSKQGVGTSTVALNVAAALSQFPDESTLLLDMDLSSGIIGFLLKLNNDHSMIEAAENAHHLDESLWPQLVTRSGKLDVIHSGNLNPDFRIGQEQIRQLLEFARRHYRTICVDLSGNLERYSLEVMHEAKYIFLVATSEIPSLHLAREKLAYLERLDMASKVRVILNRSHRKSLVTPAQVESLLGVPVTFSLSNDYQGVHRALQAGRAVERSSELGKQFHDLAAAILERKQQPEAEPKKRLVEYFSILPGRTSLATGNKRAV
jgi:pilus assembly protein CpaE